MVITNTTLTLRSSFSEKAEPMKAISKTQTRAASETESSSQKGSKPKEAKNERKTSGSKIANFGAQFPRAKIDETLYSFFLFSLTSSVHFTRVPCFIFLQSVFSEQMH